MSALDTITEQERETTQAYSEVIELALAVAELGATVPGHLLERLVKLETHLAALATLKAHARRVVDEENGEDSND